MWFKTGPIDPLVSDYQNVFLSSWFIAHNKLETCKLKHWNFMSCASSSSAEQIETGMDPSFE